MFVFSGSQANYFTIFTVCLPGFKISQTFVTGKNILPMASSIYKWCLLPVMTLLIAAGEPAAPPHPLHLSVVEINHNAREKTLEISCKIFTDDFERILSKNYKTNADLYNADRKAMDKLVKDYLQTHLIIKADDRPLTLSYLGYEKEDEVTYGYIQVENVAGVKKVEVTDKLMLDMFDDQISLIHVIVNGNRKSTKLTAPSSQAAFAF
jgi:hypothetical protein